MRITCTRTLIECKVSITKFVLSLSAMIPCRTLSVGQRLNEIGARAPFGVSVQKHFKKFKKFQSWLPMFGGICVGA